jgi:D-alanyl-lipoteichoic acid acyltransferase DltB (MBOAT superfamily)
LFLLYVFYFPTIISGPIDRYDKFESQFKVKIIFDYKDSILAFRQILWGIFKKVVIADSLSEFVDLTYSNYSHINSSTNLLAIFFYSVQIYTDFSGYSDIAIGISRLLGIRISKNFNFPFFSLNIVEFWNKWHISLTNWFADYVFTPLAIYFRNYGKFSLIIAVLVNFLIIGIWHGPNFTYVLFGFLNGIYCIPYFLFPKFFKNRKKYITYILMLINFILLSFTWVIFRSNTINDAFEFYSSTFTKTIFYRPSFDISYYLIICIFIFFYIEWKAKNDDFALEKVFNRYSKSSRLIFYLFLLQIIFASIPSDRIQHFIYFKF